MKIIMKLRCLLVLLVSCSSLSMADTNSINGNHSNLDLFNTTKKTKYKHDTKSLAATDINQEAEVEFAADVTAREDHANNELAVLNSIIKNAVEHPDADMHRSSTHLVTNELAKPTSINMNENMKIQTKKTEAPAVIIVPNYVPIEKIYGKQFPSSAKSIARQHVSLSKMPRKTSADEHITTKEILPLKKALASARHKNKKTLSKKNNPVNQIVVMHYPLYPLHNNKQKSRVSAHKEAKSPHVKSALKPTRKINQAARMKLHDA